jgi:hypothetical protein
MNYHHYHHQKLFFFFACPSLNHRVIRIYTPNRTPRLAVRLPLGKDRLVTTFSLGFPATEETPRSSFVFITPNLLCNAYLLRNFGLITNIFCNSTLCICNEKKILNRNNVNNLAGLALNTKKKSLYFGRRFPSAI